MNVPSEVKWAYDVLGLPIGTPLKECGEHWRKLSKEWHPDLHEPGSEFYNQAVEKQKDFNQAYDILKRTDIDKLPRTAPSAKPVAAGAPSPEVIYQEGRALEDQFQLFEALDIYKHLGNSGYLKAQFRLGYLYFDSIVKDLPQAAYWWKRAADQGHVLACYNLGLMYEKGMGVEQDQKAAQHYFGEAAKRGDQKAAAKLIRVGPAAPVAAPIVNAQAASAAPSGPHAALSAASKPADQVQGVIPHISTNSEQAGRAFIKRKST